MQRRLTAHTMAVAGSLSRSGHLDLTLAVSILTKLRKHEAMRVLKTTGCTSQ